MTERVILTWAVLTVVTLLTRLGPLVMARRVQDHPWMDRIAAQLPCMILVLLILHDAEARASAVSGSLSAIVAGISATLLIHIWKKQIIFSLIAGIIVYTLVQHVN